MHTQMAMHTQTAMLSSLRNNKLTLTWPSSPLAVRLKPEDNPKLPVEIAVNQESCDNEPPVLACLQEQSVFCCQDLNLYS